MKKIISMLMFGFMTSLLASKEYPLVKLANFENKKETGYLLLRKNSEVSDSEFDLTGNGIKISQNGQIYIIQSDMHIIYKIDRTYELKLVRIIDFLETGAEGIQMISNNYIFCSGNLGRFQLLDENFNQVFKIRMLNWGMRFDAKAAYYDEETNILFLQDKKEQLYSIINPCLDEEQNKKNFKTPEETSREFENGKTVNGVNVKVIDSKYLYINNNFVYFGQEKVGNYVYTKNREDYFLYNKNTKEYFNIYFSSEDEELESTAIHPSGDIYVLRMNWTTNTHNLYRIENTWDPQWRKEWYENHETENVSQTVPSTNVAINKEMICNDNLRLRSEEDTSSRVITTMQKGTKVKILKLGKAETIDGISSNWVQIEVLADGKDKDGKEIKAGTIGWCYGGYLE